MWSEIPNKETVQKTIEALKIRGINVEFFQNRDNTLKRIVELIPSGVDLSTSASRSLEEIGFVDLLKSGKHSWNNLKEKIVAQKDPAKQTDLRMKSSTATYFLGSVHAVTESGEVIVVSNTGSQLAPYAYSSKNIIWVVGTQKIVNNIEAGMRRIREYCLPLEDKRIKSTGGKGSTIAKYLIFEKETVPFRKVTLLFVNEKLGF